MNEFRVLIGKTIVNVRHMLPDEIEYFYWFEPVDETLVIEFSDGTFAIPMQDPEGNGPGFLHIGKYKAKSVKRRR